MDGGSDIGRNEEVRLILFLEKAKPNLVWVIQDKEAVYLSAFLYDLYSISKVESIAQEVKYVYLVKQSSI